MKYVSRQFSCQTQVQAIVPCEVQQRCRCFAHCCCSTITCLAKHPNKVGFHHPLHHIGDGFAESWLAKHSPHRAVRLHRYLCVFDLVEAISKVCDFRQIEKRHSNENDTSKNDIRSKTTFNKQIDQSKNDIRRKRPARPDCLVLHPCVTPLCWAMQARAHVPESLAWIMAMRLHCLDHLLALLFTKAEDDHRLQAHC